LDLALTSRQFALAKWLLLNANVKWVDVSPAAYRCISAIIPAESLDWSELFDILEFHHLPVAIEHDGLTLLSRAVSDNSLSLLRACFRYRDRFSAELQIAACASACGSDEAGIVLEDLLHWRLEVESRDSAGHSLLWIAVPECKVKIVRLVLKRGANVGSIRDLLSPKELAFRLGNEEIIHAFCSLAPLRPTENSSCG
jgi:hypothetical protein